MVDDSGMNSGLPGDSRRSDELPVESRKFQFGDNWRKYSYKIDDSKLKIAGESLANMLQLKSLEGRRFLDIGCGSGIFSLAASHMGAAVVSFDSDAECVRVTRDIKDKYAKNAKWEVLAGSILDCGFVDSLGKFDTVYSWGVLHHTGKMWIAIENACGMVNPGGWLYISIYNDQGKWSRFWKFMKRTYNKNPITRALVTLICVPYFVFRHELSQLRKMIFCPKASRMTGRGMDWYRDIIDWIGGYPFEVAKPGEVVEYVNARGFVLLKINTVGARRGCNEFVFKRMAG